MAREFISTSYSFVFLFLIGAKSADVNKRNASPVTNIFLENLGKTFPISISNEGKEILALVSMAQNYNS